MESLTLCTIITKENLVTFENNIIYKGDLPLVVCMDFEIALTNNYFNPKQNKMFVVSYAIVFAFRLKLNLDCVVVERSFEHSLKKLTTIDH